MDGPDGLDIVWVTGDPTGPDGWGSAQLGTIDRFLPPFANSSACGKRCPAPAP